MTLIDSSSLVVLGVLLVLVTFLNSLLFSPTLKRNGKALRKPPDTLPLVGNGLRFLQARQKLFHWFTQCEKIFGYETFAISVPTLPPGVVINDPRNLEFVFKNESLFGKGEFFKTRSWDLFGYGIINADGNLWKAQRKAGVAFLNTSNMKVLNDVALVQYLEKSTQLLLSRAKYGMVVDLQEVFHELTSLLMGKMAYNMEMHTNDEFTISFDYASGVTAERFQNPLWFITDHFRRPFWNAIREIAIFGDEIVAKAVSDTKQPSQKSTSNSSEQLDQISGSLIKSLRDSIPDSKIVADAALNYLSAGRDTTAQALTWIFYLIMRHPAVRAKILGEIENLVDQSGSFSPTLVTPVTAPYTLAVFTESIRLYPPVPFEIKQVVASTTLPDGTYLPNGSVVVWCTWAMNRSITTWGADAEEFCPDRWLVDGNFVARSTHEFPVFNGGQRLCLGKKMAEGVAVRVIAVLLRMFDFVPVTKEERVSKSSLTLPMEGGLPVRVTSRQ